MKRSIYGLILFYIFLGHGYAQNDVKADSIKTEKTIKTDRKIHAGDLLQITVYGHDEFPKDVRVELDGTIKYPFMKDIRVDGMTLEQLSNILRKNMMKR